MHNDGMQIPLRQLLPGSSGAALMRLPNCAGASVLCAQVLAEEELSGRRGDSLPEGLFLWDEHGDAGAGFRPGVRGISG